MVPPLAFENIEGYQVKHEYKHEFVKHEHALVKHEHEHEHELKDLPLNLTSLPHIRFEASKFHWLAPHKV